jgi:hypothetical protein
VTDDQVTVKIMHRVRTSGIPFWSDFDPADGFVQAYSFTTGFPQCGHVEMLVRIVFMELNIDEPHAPWAVEYRARRNRSLSAGDVVVVGEQAFACNRVGWQPVRLAGEQVLAIDVTHMEWEDRQ